MSNKTTIKLIIAGLLLIVLIVIGLIVWRPGRPNSNDGRNNGQGADQAPTPEFLNTAEKTDLNTKGLIDVSPETEVQVLSRDSQGQAMVVKIINSDQDIVADPSRVAPLSPRLIQ
jgi:hypothetical protein